MVMNVRAAGGAEERGAVLQARSGAEDVRTRRDALCESRCGPKPPCMAPRRQLDQLQLYSPAVLRWRPMLAVDGVAEMT